ncbi:Alkaline phosphatase synthesis sensor protein PhoR [Thalassovita gelatinovora]|uniref:histidine kinase n=1 Tax=Thalassovita gelatinovora TaxID=53501 RepID=A0A0P1FKN2_THAGE|nr:ATP-binding protein [Thalassovita gelatinovora]QIZ79462.1 two-component sensor histidine kinase [Thalassovita gelatinovora]CUH62831.1 Alkaline phosphatase synthesis sensor protein PhoR [Thalassovita gelatinovora]SEQ11157.1 two-component system, OmpR family, phosphate regulon sensor histidine kinase PhoR [Thalassovita gelatinovora]
MTFDVIQGLLDALPVPTLLVSKGERVIGANARVETLLGQGLSGRHLITVLRQPSVLDAIEACEASRQTQTTRYLTSTDRNEMTYQVHCGYVEIADAKGVLVSFEDITHVEAISQMRRDFVANVSHELRTPLTALMGFIETLQGPAKNDPVAQERFLGIMMTEASRMNRLVSDLLSLSQVESEERIRPSLSIDLTLLIGSILRSIGPVAEKARVALVKEAPSDPILVPGDEDQLRQVFTNLIENAIKYGGNDQTVTVKLTQMERDPALRGPGVRVEVCDTGPGIDQVHLPRLTERFYRVDSHRSREMGGTGLGLAIVKHIVNRHRGRLKIDSSPEEGSRFTVILPALD